MRFVDAQLGEIFRHKILSTHLLPRLVKKKNDEKRKKEGRDNGPKKKKGGKRERARSTVAGSYCTE